MLFSAQHTFFIKLGPVTSTRGSSPLVSGGTHLRLRGAGRQQRGRGRGRGRSAPARRRAVPGGARADLLQRHVLGRVHYLGAGAGGGDERAHVGGGRRHLSVLLVLEAGRRGGRRAYRRVTGIELWLESIRSDNIRS